MHYKRALSYWKSCSLKSLYLKAVLCMMSIDIRALASKRENSSDKRISTNGFTCNMQLFPPLSTPRQQNVFWHECAYTSILYISSVHNILLSYFLLHQVLEGPTLGPAACSYEEVGHRKTETKSGGVTIPFCIQVLLYCCMQVF